MKVILSNLQITKMPAFDCYIFGEYNLLHEGRKWDGKYCEVEGKVIVFFKAASFTTAIFLSDKYSGYHF